MSLHGQYDEQNIFAKIIRGEAPCWLLYEDEDVLAFLDLFPQSYGHCPVIPKNAPARNILEIDDANLAKVMAVVRKLTRRWWTSCNRPACRWRSSTRPGRADGVPYPYAYRAALRGRDTLGIHASQQVDAAQRCRRCRRIGETSARLRRAWSARGVAKLASILGGISGSRSCLMFPAP